MRGCKKEEYLGHTNLGLCDPLFGTLFFKMEIKPRIDANTKNLLDYIRQFDAEHKKKVLTLDIHRETIKCSELLVKANFIDLQNKNSPLRIKSHERINGTERYVSFLIPFYEHFEEFKESGLNLSMLKSFENVNNAIYNTRHNFLYSLFKKQGINTISKDSLARLHFKNGNLEIYLQKWMPNTSYEEQVFVGYYSVSKTNPSLKIFIKPTEIINLENEVLVDSYIEKLTEKADRLTKINYKK